MEEPNSVHKSVDEKAQGHEKKPADCCYPNSFAYKLLILILICVAGSGSSYCDVATLQDKFQNNLNITTTQYSILFSLNAWPSVFLCFIGGLLIDNVFGIRLGTIIFIFVQTFGQILFSFGATINVYWVMMAGQFLFGAGDELLNIAFTSYPVIWFKNKQLNMVFGLQIAAYRLTSVVNYWTMEPIYEEVEKYVEKEHAVGITLFITSTACIFAAICAIILGFMDKRAEKILNRKSEVIQDIVLISDTKSFKLDFWILCIICLSYYVGFFSFISLAKVFMKEKFQLSPDEANRINSLVYMIPAFASPLFGLAVDKTGKPLLWIFMGLFAVVTSFLLLALTEVVPQVGIILLGHGYSICSVVIWSMAAIIIPEEKLGTAYGIMNSLKNLGLAVFSMFSGMIVDNSGYFTLQMYLVGFIITALTCVIFLWIRTESCLNMTPKNREVNETVNTKSD